MSEPTLAAVEALGAPLLADAEKALTPEAQKVLTDLHQFVAGEADKLRQELPTLVQTGVQHLHDIGGSILARYQAVMEHIDAHLTGTVTPAAPSAPAQTSAPAPAAPVVTDPTVAPSAPTTEASAPSSTGSSTDSSTPSPTEAAPAEQPPAV